MPIYNSNIPSFKGLVRKSHLTKNSEDSEIFINVYVFGLQSADGKILTFHVMTDEGMLRSRLKGSCAGCPSSIVTLKQGVERMIKHYVPEVNSVTAVNLD